MICHHSGVVYILGVVVNVSDCKTWGNWLQYFAWGNCSHVCTSVVSDGHELLWNVINYITNYMLKI